MLQEMLIIQCPLLHRSVCETEFTFPFCGWNLVKNGLLRGIWAYKGRGGGRLDNGENCVMRSCIICVVQ
jgi:hypothetical protein